MFKEKRNQNNSTGGKIHPGHLFLLKLYLYKIINRFSKFHFCLNDRYSVVRDQRLKFIHS